MPPPNSTTQDTPVADPSTSPFLELEALAGPVPDLASTLTTIQAEQDANDDNVNFLRTQLLRDDIALSSNLDRLYREQLRRDRDLRAAHHRDSESQRRMTRPAGQNERRYSPSGLRDLHDPAGPVTQTSTSSYQGWAPEQEGRSDSENHHGLPTMSRSSAEFYDDQRRALVSFARHIESSNRESATSGGRRSTAGSTYATSESSLRTAALLQSVRNSPFSAHSRTMMQNHLLERERSGLETASRDQYPASDQRRRSALGSRNGRQQDHSLSSISNTVHDQARRNWITSGYRRQQEEEYEHQRRQENSKLDLGDAIKYLERLPFCDSHEDSLSSAAAGGFAKEEFFTINHEDFILDTAMIDPPAQTSWLKVGGTFSGSQHATSGAHLVRNRSDARGSRHTDLPQLGQAQVLPPNRHSFSYTLSNPAPRSSGTYSRSRAPLGSYENVDEAASQFRTLPLNAAAERSLEQPSSVQLSEERWPVQVKLHSINYENMTLAGTMEAFNVPDKNSLTQVSSITTFLEGEIIDFNKFTLKTKNYTTDENTDPIYWRMLEPFKKLTDDEIVRGLLSKKWMREQLRERYILMRWKEKCFVKPLDAHSVLTISGFYYISMRRSDGRIEGLYYDPSSAPFQHLSMMPEGKRQFPAYQFT
ncbi:MAG: hypothetical protein Q9186_000933 [Xanthomendoza sp. 1 TL-2023]